MGVLVSKSLTSLISQKQKNKTGRCGTHWIQVPGSQTLDLEPGPYAPEHTAHTT